VFELFSSVKYLVGSVLTQCTLRTTECQSTLH